MKKRLFLAFGFLLAALTALTFLSNPRKFKANEKKSDVVVKTIVNKVDTFSTKNNVLNHELYSANDTLTDVANFIAGKKSFKTEYLSKLINDTSWLKYAGKIENIWQKLDTTRFNGMRNWSSNQLASISNSPYNLFYPFSGPDYLNANLFFPNCDSITMMGLEPVGTLPPVQEIRFKDSLYKYVNSLKKSLNTVLNLSFFKTKDMFSDLRTSELNGALHLILWFAARENYSIKHVKQMAINYNGLVTYAVKDSAYKHSRIHGVEVGCVKNGKLKIVRYFSTDISDHGFNKQKALRDYFSHWKFQNTLVKSASYLMHAANFTYIRNLILTKSKYLLQDDTGIPYKHFDAKKYDVILYGIYEKPINLFSMHYQDDLHKAYDSLDTKKLPFGIGYKYRKNESTWMLITNKELNENVAKTEMAKQ